MNIRVLAEQDLSFILEDLENGTAQAVTFIDANKIEYILNCWGADIGVMLDVTTGLMIPGRNIEIYARLSSLSQYGLETISENWRVKIGNKNFLVKSSIADRTLGIIRIVLETIKNVG